MRGKPPALNELFAVLAELPLEMLNQCLRVRLACVSLRAHLALQCKTGKTAYVPQ